MKGGTHLKPALLMVGLYIFFKFGMPLFTAPLPASLIMLYLMLTFSGIMIFMTLSGTSTDSFLGPIFRFISGDGQNGSMKTARLAVLALFPLLVGWQTYTSTALSEVPPSENRTIHPAPPGEFTGLSNPVPNTPDNIMQGKGLYAARCSPCHGLFDGKGPAARGFSPPPRPISRIRRQSRCCRKAICSGGSRRVESGSLSRGCHGSPRCLVGNSNSRTRRFGKSSWASMTERARSRAPGSKRRRAHGNLNEGSWA